MTFPRKSLPSIVLRARNEPIRHKAAFKGCQPEFQSLVSRLIKQLEEELISEKLINRDN